MDRGGAGGCSDEQLMEGYAHGDVVAFEALFARYEDRVYGFFLRRTGSPERAEDLYQELFLRLHRARASYDPARCFSPWMFQIARRLLIDDLRRTAVRREAALVEAEHCGEPRLEPESLASSRERLGEVLDRLSDVERRVLVASKLEGCEYADLTQELGKSVVAIKKLASRALQRLRAAGIDPIALRPAS